MDRNGYLIMFILVCIIALLASCDDKKPPLKPTREEQAVLDFTNAERKRNQLPPLQFNQKLMQAARDHVANMAKQETLNHELDGKKMEDRLKEVEYNYAHAGENIAWKQPTPREVVRGWMNSEGHKANILHEDYTEIGIATAKSPKGHRYWIQVFGTPLVK